MASIEDLPADQQAVLRLLLDQGREYGEIATTLRMAPAAVRDRAHDALNALGPDDSPVGRERRAQIADYLLSQQSGAEREATEDLLSGSDNARGWARSVAGALAPLAKDGLPPIPGAAQPADSRSALLGDEPPAASAPRTSMQRPSSRRGGALLLTGAGLLAAVAVGFFIGRATKSDETAKPTASTQAASSIDVLGQTNLKPPSGSPDTKALGIAQFVKEKGENGQRLLNVIAQGLPRAPGNSGYGVWLTKAGVDPVWLGYFQAVTASGEVGAQSPLKVDPAKYDRVILTRQQGKEPTKPGTVYLEGPVTLTASAG